MKKPVLSKSAKSNPNNYIVILKGHDWRRRLLSKQKRYVFKSLLLKPPAKLPESNKSRRSTKSQSD